MSFHALPDRDYTDVSRERLIAELEGAEKIMDHVIQGMTPTQLVDLVSYAKIVQAKYLKEFNL